jgi:uncharacterized protein YggT (Ycf19 family)
MFVIEHTRRTIQTLPIALLCPISTLPKALVSYNNRTRSPGSHRRSRCAPADLEFGIMDLVQGGRTLPSSHPTSNKGLQIIEYALQALHIYDSVDPYLRPIRRFIFQTQRQIYPILLPYLNTAANLAHKSPAIITVGILLLFLLIAMQVLNFIRRVMVWWFKLVMRIAFWTVVVLFISAIWQRGVERTVGDLVGWSQELNDVWWREYRRWEGYQNQGKAQGRNSPPIMGRTNARASWR